MTLRIDSHAHVFRRDLPLTPGARHAPQRDALLPELLSLFDASGVTHGVLTAPSFLGTDNSYLLAALAAAPGRLRGTVTVDPTFDRARLEALDREGVIGIRFNMLRTPVMHDLRSAPWQRVLADVAALDWHVEIYVEGPRLPALLEPSLAAGARVVVDHFGSPDPALGVNCPGFSTLLDAVRKGRTFVKLSAPYRLGGADPRPYVDALLDAGGPAQLVWASDWPFVGHEDSVTYHGYVDDLAAWIPDPQTRHVVRVDTPARLFGFDRPRGRSAHDPLEERSP